MEEYNPSGVLEKILIKGIRFSGEDLNHKFIRGISKAGAFYLEGGLFGEGRKFFAKELGLTDAQFTKRHALAFGVAGMFLEGAGLYFGGEKVKEALVPGILADVLHISYNVALGIYIGALGVGQNLWRYEHARKTGKGFGAIGIIPLITNADYYLPKVYRILKLIAKKNFNKIKNGKRKTY